MEGETLKAADPNLPHTSCVALDRTQPLWAWRLVVGGCADSDATAAGLRPVRGRGGRTRGLPTPSAWTPEVGNAAVGTLRTLDKRFSEVTPAQGT